MMQSRKHSSNFQLFESVNYNETLEAAIEDVLTCTDDKSFSSDFDFEDTIIVTDSEKGDFCDIDPIPLSDNWKINTSTINTNEVISPCLMRLSGEGFMNSPMSNQPITLIGIFGSLQKKKKYEHNEVSIMQTRTPLTNTCTVMGDTMHHKEESDHDTTNIGMSQRLILPLEVQIEMAHTKLKESIQKSQKSRVHYLQVIETMFNVQNES